MTQLQDHVTLSGSPADDYRHIAVRKVGGVIGAVVEGVRANGDVDPAAFAELRTALLRHKVVFLRDQHGLTDDDQRAFARQFGPLLAGLAQTQPVVAGGRLRPLLLLPPI